MFCTNMHAAMRAFLHIVFLLSYNVLANKQTTTVAKEAGNIECIDKEREALLKFKDGIKVDRCGFLASWGDREDQKDCCKWHGIHCSNFTGHVTMLYLRSHSIKTCLKGKLSPSLAELEHLNYLDLSGNDFEEQSIPSFLGSFTKLKYLNLSLIYFRGNIPPQLGNLSALLSLDLNSYGTDTLTAVQNLQWLSRLTLLRYIDLSGIDLRMATDWFQVINNLPLLTDIHMGFCNLPPVIESPLPNANFSRSLRALDLRENFLKPSIFRWLFNLSGVHTLLEHIDLSNNNIESPIPQEFGSMLSLSYLDLSGNFLTGRIPKEFGNMHSLSHLDLSGNQLTADPFPYEFGNLHSLSYLALSQTELEGHIPETILNLKHLAYLDLSFTSIRGHFPEIIGNLCTLQSLNFKGNNLTEELYSIIQKLSGCAHKSLQRLDLSGNMIWGSVPRTISIFSSLRELDLYDNQLNDTISKSIRQLSKLETLAISSNSLKGTISESHFSKLSRLNYLDLSDNLELAFNISSNWVPSFQLDSLILHNCMLGPQFPRWLQSQRKLQQLDISDAGINDGVPGSFWNSLPPNLSLLNMSNNRIHGTLPNMSITFDSLPEIDLSTNHFEGAIPPFLGKLDSLFLSNNRFSDAINLLCPKTTVVLFILDLSNNFLLGELPNCWTYFDQLAILRLENNNFSGHLPSSIGALKQLQSLHLRNNSFFGAFPMFLENCTSLAVLDLAYNSFAGHIPADFGDPFKILALLILRNNKLSGRLPVSLCQLSYLQILDVSGNHISGTIPRCIYNLTEMYRRDDFFPDIGYAMSPHVMGTYSDAETIMWERKEQNFGHTSEFLKLIDLSSNNLEGQIPEEISFLSGLVSLNLSRNNLTGVITPNISQMTSLELLDLSNNHISGEIPTSLATMSYLHVLDFSNNNISGRIPLGTQLQTFSASAYSGNPELCGEPLPKKCPGDQASVDQPKEVDTNQEDDNNDNLFPGLYISVALGFIVGFWGVCGTLVLNGSWRHAFFQFVDDTKDRFYVLVMVNIARLRRKQQI